MTESEPEPEPWLRGTLADLSAEQRAVLHALELAEEDIERWCAPLSGEELAARPHGLPPVAFHLRHIAGSLDRLLSYAEGKTLNPEQMRWMAEELTAHTDRPQLLATFHQGLAAAQARIRALDTARWPEARTVGRQQLPSTVAGLIIHCADHTQRHTGQAITTAKIMLEMRRASPLT